jgi:glutamate--cysteine ligase
MAGLDPSTAEDAQRPIRSFDDLLLPFRRGADRGRRRLGIESEKFGVLVDSGKPVSYDGKTCGVLGVFDALCRQRQWNTVRERDDLPIVALEREGTHGKLAITLEPGAQLELSGAPVPSVHDVATELDEHLADIAPVSRDCGVRWLSAGFHPVASPEQLPWVPKQRYAIMREYFPQVGTRGLDMMRRTATVQVNLDFADERDAMRKMRVALKLSPVATAIFANSPFVEGRIGGVKSERAMVWLDTDRHRTGLLPTMLAPGAGFATYAEWALDVPMYLVRRGSAIIANTGQTFRSFWENGYEEERATLGDWILHLNTLFPEARLQRTIEVRSADALPRRWFMAVPALWAGLLYDEEALSLAEALIEPLSHDDLVSARPQIARVALDAKLGATAVRAIAESAIAIAMDGLARRAELDSEGRDERVHLEPIASLVSRGRSPADELLEGLEGEQPDLRQQIIERTAM